MECSLISSEKDPMGVAIKDYFLKPSGQKITVVSPDFDDDYIPVSTLFREYESMPLAEKKALGMCKGRILDVGAGSGCHALHLQSENKEVYAIDVSPYAVEVMKERGVKNCSNINFFDDKFVGQFDTILMMMNGIGIVGKVDCLFRFFNRLKSLLSPNGIVIFDSTDLKYLYEDDEGGCMIDITADYYGEVEFTMKYKNIVGNSFKWLYIDAETLNYYANQCGFKVEKVFEGNNCDYLGVISYI